MTKEGSLNICNLRGRCYGPMNRPKPIINRNLDTSILLNLDGGGGYPILLFFAKMVMIEVFTIGAKKWFVWGFFFLVSPPPHYSTDACRLNFRYPTLIGRYFLLIL